MATALGRVLIQIEGALQGLEFHTEDERDRFLKYFGDTLDVNLRQKLLTWRANRTKE